MERSGTMLQPHELWVEKTNAPKSEMSGMKRNGRLKDSSCVGWRCGVNEGMQLCGMTERTRQKTQGSATTKTVTARLARSDPQASTTISGGGPLYKNI